MHWIPIEYLLREEDVGIYDSQCYSREYNIKHGICFSGKAFKEDSELFSNLLVQYVVAIGVGGNSIAWNKSYNNFIKCYLELKVHYQT